MQHEKDLCVLVESSEWREFDLASRILWFLVLMSVSCGRRTCKDGRLNKDQESGSVLEETLILTGIKKK